MLKLHVILIAFLVVVTISLAFFTISIRKEIASPKLVSLCEANYDDQDSPSLLKHRKVKNGVLSKLNEHNKVIEQITNPLKWSPKCKREVFLILMVVSAS